jgi:dienelactone hydrolase
MQAYEEQQVTVHSARVALPGTLEVPADPSGIVVFAHGSGSSHDSPRNHAVAELLVGEGFATLLFDLLTHEEEVAERYTHHLRFDISLLATRLVGALQWVRRFDRLASLPVGLFGASTGAAAALITAARVHGIGAVVSRGGRPDLAGDALADVVAPTLLIVGGADPDVLELNRRALQQMTTDARLHIVPGATHLFEEPGALREVADLAAMWFRRHLPTPAWLSEHGVSA